MGEGNMASRNFTLHRIWARQATIGFLGATTPSIWSAFVGAFEHKLRNLGWIDGSNIAIEYGWAHGNKDRYAAIAQKFVEREVDIIVTSGTGPAIAAKNATSSIPIVVAAVGDPVGINLVKKLKSPGGNITGLSNGQTDLVVPRLLQLRKVVPRLTRLGVIGNRASKNVKLEIAQIKKNAGKLGIGTVIVLPNIERPAQITPLIKGLQGRVDALFVCTDPFITTHHVAINIAAAAVKIADDARVSGLCRSRRPDVLRTGLPRHVCERGRSRRQNFARDTTGRDPHRDPSHQRTRDQPPHRQSARPDHTSGREQTRDDHQVTGGDVLE